MAGSSPSGTSRTALILRRSRLDQVCSTDATEEWSFQAPQEPILTEGDIFLSGGTTLKGFGKAAGIPAGTLGYWRNIKRRSGYGTGFGGAQTAAVCCFGGYPTHTNNTETYDGTSWTEVNDLKYC